jgi:hypothetical protein
MGRWHSSIKMKWKNSGVIFSFYTAGSGAFGLVSCPAGVRSWASSSRLGALPVDTVAGQLLRV